jgi:hypothetical protein
MTLRYWRQTVGRYALGIVVLSVQFQVMLPAAVMGESTKTSLEMAVFSLPVPNATVIVPDVTSTDDTYWPIMEELDVKPAD